MKRTRRLRLGVSYCLLGQKVRYDGQPIEAWGAQYVLREPDELLNLPGLA